MKHIVSFSGGRTSAYMVHLLKQKEIDEGWDIDYIFFETHAEHPKTYDFIKKCVEYFDIDLKVIRLDVNHEYRKANRNDIISVDDMGWNPQFWLDMTKKYGNPTAISMHCTRELKSNLMNRYVKQFDEYCIWLGIRADEQRRLKSKGNFRYLAEISEFEKADVLSWWSGMPFDLEIQEHLGNCVFCVKKSTPKIALAFRDEPELGREWRDMLLSDSTRVKAEGRPIDEIYRGRLTPNGIIEMYSCQERDDLHMSMRHARKYESGACTESCEVFSDQMDLFND